MLVFFFQEKEDPEYAVELNKAINEQERKRVQMQIYYGMRLRVANAQFW